MKIHVKASSGAQNHPASSAVDGKSDTRWAASGKSWIQVPLNLEVEFKEIEISWYQSSKRKYRFNLQVSNDGNVWGNLQEQSGNAYVLENKKQSDVTVHVIEKEISLKTPALPELTIVPEEGTVVIYGLSLKPKNTIQYMVRCPFSLSRLVKVTDTGQVVYKAEKQACQAFPDPYADDLKAGTNRNFQVLSPLDFLAEFTQHIPPKGSHLIRY